MKFKTDPFWILHKILLKNAFLSTKLAHSLYQNTSKSPIQEWRNIKGDQTLRLDYDLNQNSLVLDVGGYEGQWSSDIYSRYRCKIIIFEPVAEFASAIKKRFNANDDITVCPFGLADKTENLEMTVADNSSSLFT